MSFSKDVKEELSKHLSLARHCQIAELAAILSMCGSIQRDEEGNYHTRVQTENLTVARKYFTLVKKTFNINTEISIRRSVNLKKSRIFILTIKDQSATLNLIKAIKLTEESKDKHSSMVSSLVIQNTCCKRAFIRGAFLAGGSISDPAKAYHFEIVCSTVQKAEQLQTVMNYFELDAKIVLRKKCYVVYIKEGARIVDILNVMEAHVALMNLENVRILKEMRNSINRQVNCETANINKTVIAATKQIEDIHFIMKTVGFSELTEGLEEIAELRVNQPDASLKELGALLNPPIGKSGVNHRLRKLSIIADNLREQKEEESYENKENGY